LTVIRRFFALLLSAAVLLSLSGCFAGSIDELYCLPEPAEEYLQLQALINEEIKSGSEYAAPTDGNYRQSVQLFDLDGNGEDEALAFFRDAAQKPKICIYSTLGGDYTPALTIEGDGTAIGSIEYADLNSDGISELLVAWQISTGLRILKAYSMVGWSGDPIITADCNRFLVNDMNGDGQSELLVIRFGGSEGGFVDMYSYSPENELEISSARFSTGIYSMKRVQTGFLSQNQPVLLIESDYAEDWLVTDLFISRRGRLMNLSLDRLSGISNTLRHYSAFCTDVDGDHYIEVPAPFPLYSQTSSANNYGIDWYSYSAYGTRTLDVSTYHCFLDGWYLELTPEWREDLTVRRDDSVAGEHTVILSHVDADTGIVSDFLAVFTLTGENMRERAEIDGRFVIRDEGSTVYAAKILGSSGGAAVRESDVKERFKLIYSEWMTDLL